MNDSWEHLFHPGLVTGGADPSLRTVNIAAVHVSTRLIGLVQVTAIVVASQPHGKDVLIRTYASMSMVCSWVLQSCAKQLHDGYAGTLSCNES